MIYSARSDSRAASNESPPRKVHKLSTRKPNDATPADETEEQFNIDLLECILTRIEARLPGRIRRLAAYTTNNAIVLTGECSTFYTKQMAQHTAMGVLEYERLINNIDVRVTK